MIRVVLPQSLQLLEDQKKKLDVFCDQSYKNVSLLSESFDSFLIECIHF